jgi:hypothetical protein
MEAPLGLIAGRGIGLSFRTSALRILARVSLALETERDPIDQGTSYRL